METGINENKGGLNRHLRRFLGIWLSKNKDSEPETAKDVKTLLDQTLTVPLGSDGLHHTRTTECEHTVVIGSTGCGKTFGVVRPALDWYRQHPEYKGIIYDFGGLAEDYYDPEHDVIINPFDARSLRVNIFSMIKSREDCYSIASVLIPTPEGSSDPYWTLTPCDLLASCLVYCYINNMRTNDELIKVLNWTRDVAMQELSTFWFCKQTAKYLGEEKLASTIGSVIGAYTNVLSYLPTGQDVFDAESWLNGSDGRGWIFLTNNFKVTNVLAPWLNLFLWWIVSTLISPDGKTSMKSKRDNRYFIMLDEVNTMPSSVVEIISMCTTNGRKFGICMWLLFQDISGFELKFTDKGSRKILGSCKTRIFMMAGADENTANYMSSVSGTQNRSYTKPSITGIGSTGVSLTEEMQLDAKLLAPSVFENLKPFEGYAKIGFYGQCHSWFRGNPNSPSTNQPAFVQRDGLNMEVLRLEYAEFKAEHDEICARVKEKDEAKEAA